MADAYGNQIGHWKVKVNAWVVSYTATTDTVRIQAIGVMSSGWYTESYNVTASVWINGVTSSSDASLGFQRLNPGERVLYTHDFVVNKTEGARGLSCRAKLTLPYGEPGTSTASVTVSVGGIQYSKPNAPSSLSIARVDDSAANLTWRNNPDDKNRKPYKQVIVDRQSGTGGGSVGGWGMIAALGGGASNYRATGLKANSKYNFRILARNTAGDSAHVNFTTLYTTPAAPKSVKAVKTGDKTVQITADASNTYAWSVDFERSTDNGATWTSISRGETVKNGKVTITDEDAPAGTVLYRGRTFRFVYGDGGTSLGNTGMFGPYTVSNSVTTISPPNAPTILNPVNGATYNLSDGMTVSWKPNHPDGTNQSSAQVEYTIGNGTAQTYTVTGSTTEFPIDVAAYYGSWKVRVRTKGLHADWGAWSDYVSFTLASAPSVVITGPDDPVTAAPFTVAWSVADSTGVSRQHVTVTADGRQAYETDVDPSLRELKVTPSMYLPANGERLTVSVTVTGGSTLSATASRLVTVAYTPPASPYMAFEQDESYAGVITVSYGTPATGEPATEYVSIYRVTDSGDLLVADRLGNHEQCIDRIPPLNTDLQYRVVAHAPSGASSSTLVDARVESGFSVLNFDTDASEALVLGFDEQVTQSRSHATSEYHFARGDNPLPVSFSLRQLDSTVTVSGSLDWDQALYLRMLALADEYTYAWWREGSGMRQYCKAEMSVSVDVSDDKRISYSISLTCFAWEEPQS